MLVNLCEFFILAHIGKGEQVNAVMRVGGARRCWLHDD